MRYGLHKCTKTHLMLKNCIIIIHYWSQSRLHRRQTVIDSKRLYNNLIMTVNVKTITHSNSNIFNIIYVFDKKKKYFVHLIYNLLPCFVSSLMMPFFLILQSSYKHENKRTCHLNIADSWQSEEKKKNAAVIH